MFIEFIHGSKEDTEFRWQIEVAYVFPGFGRGSLSPDSSCGFLCGFLLHFHGRYLRRFSSPSLSDERARFTSPAVSSTNLIFNIVAIPSGLPIHPGRKNGLAIGLDHYPWNTPRGLYWSLHQDQVPSGSEALQGFYGVRSPLHGLRLVLDFRGKTRQEKSKPSR